MSGHSGFPHFREVEYSPPVPVYVQLPSAWRSIAGGDDELAATGATLHEVVYNVVARHPALRKCGLTSERRGQGTLQFYLNGEDIRYLQGLATPVRDGDVVVILPAVLIDTQPKAPAALSRDELIRYGRHVTLPEVGKKGQEKLKASSAVIVGAGGLGSPAALYLAAAGVGRIGLVDFDVVDASNLQRQILHGTTDVGRSKLQSARAAIEAINPHVTVDLHETRLASTNALEVLAPYDVVLDGTDNFATRYLINDACVLLGKPNVYGSVFRFEGQASVFWAAHGPCYRCLYPEPPPPGLVPNCAEGGVLGVLPGLVGMIQATEAVKLLLGIGETLVGRLLLYNALTMTFREMKLGKEPSCPICGEARKIHHLIDYEEFCGTAAPAPADDSSHDVTPIELKEALDGERAPLLLDVRESHEFELAHLPGAIHVPLGQLPQRWSELDRQADIVCYCRSGARSATAATFLREQGFARVRNLTGGILRWADDVDSSVPKY